MRATMLPVLPKKHALVASAACAAFALLSSTPAFAQQTGGTAPKSGTTDGAKKSDKDAKDKEKAAAQTNSQADQQQAGEQAKKSEPVEDAEKKAEEQEKEASRAVFVSGDIAFTRVDLGGISDNLAIDKEGANGLLYGFAAGLRLKNLRVGARWRVFDTSEYNLWSVAGTIGYGLPMRPLSPILSANLGYVWDQKIDQGAFSSSLPKGTVLPPDVDLRGLLVGIDLNAAYWVTKFLRVGAFIGTDFFFLSRPQASLPASIFPIDESVRNKPLYNETGSGISYTINVGLRGAFDIGF